MVPYLVIHLDCRNFGLNSSFLCPKPFRHVIWLKYLIRFQRAVQLSSSLFHKAWFLSWKDHVLPLTIFLYWSLSAFFGLKSLLFCHLDLGRSCLSAYALDCLASFPHFRACLLHWTLRCNRHAKFTATFTFKNFKRTLIMPAQCILLLFFDLLFQVNRYCDFGETWVCMFKGELYHYHSSKSHFNTSQSQRETHGFTN